VRTAADAPVLKRKHIGVPSLADLQTIDTGGDAFESMPTFRANPGANAKWTTEEAAIHFPRSPHKCAPPPDVDKAAAKRIAQAVHMDRQLDFGQSPADQSLLPAGKTAGDDMWCGWTIQTSQDGSMFYYHPMSGLSQWQIPCELNHVLGEWAFDDESRCWKNDLLGASSWKDPRGATNVFQAAFDGNVFFLQLYAGVGGLLDAADSKNRSALHYTCAGGSAQAVVYLLQSQASVDFTDQGGSSPLHWACRYGHTQIAQMLLDAKSHPDRQNELGDTPMHEAAALGQMDPVQWLVFARANPLLKNRESQTPAQVAAHNQATNVAAFLKIHQENWRSAPEPIDASDMERAELPNSRKSGILRPASDSDSEKETDEPEPSLALVLVRAARPVLRGVQWLANRVLGEKKTDLGAANKFSYDENAGKWVLRRPSNLHRHRSSVSSYTDESEVSAASGSDDDLRPLPKLAPSRRRRIPRLREHRGSQDSDGAPGP